MKTAVVYLYRAIEGKNPLYNFFHSYEKHYPSIKHDLILIFKAKNKTIDSNIKELVKKYSPKFFYIDDYSNTDISAYLEVAKQFNNYDNFIFFNTFSKILSDNWLENYLNGIDKDNVGLVGSSASCESILSSNKLFAKIAWAAHNNYLKFDYDIYNAYRTYILAGNKKWLIRNYLYYLFFSRNKNDFSYFDKYEDEFDDYWKILTNKNGIFNHLLQYKNFPNPHIRSNGFCVKSSLIKHFLPEKYRKKKFSYEFESSPESLSNFVLNLQKEILLVDKLGNLYGIDDWPLSNTFRLNSQSMLMISDNQTINYDNVSKYERYILNQLTWGILHNNMTSKLFLNQENDFKYK